MGLQDLKEYEGFFMKRINLIKSHLLSLMCILWIIPAQSAYAMNSGASGGAGGGGGFIGGQAGDAVNTSTAVSMNFSEHCDMYIESDNYAGCGTTKLSNSLWKIDMDCGWRDDADEWDSGWATLTVWQEMDTTDYNYIDYTVGWTNASGEMGRQSGSVSVYGTDASGNNILLSTAHSQKIDISNYTKVILYAVNTASESGGHATSYINIQKLNLINENISPAYGGSSYAAPTNAVTNSNQTALDYRTGNGYVSLTTTSGNYSSTAYWNGFLTPDTANPDKVNANVSYNNGQKIVSWDKPDSNGTVYEYKAQIWRIDLNNPAGLILYMDTELN